MTHGFDRPLYVLPFDHRGSFETGMFGWKGALTPEQTAQIADGKTGDLRRFQGGRRRRGAEAEGRHPGGRAIRGSHTARCQGGRFYDRLSCREERTG